ncbi:ultraviolet-B receptor UVR8 isoform X1 [Prunus yedoensis var. nudiflora]|uniref:Ultraviolet-B receptor UVR8 isoform X1 n=1 Tax=Prunus yedoensis var. nudiflora TaxID=2094558 RepID=A0A314UNF2_PRUYE|nr:ultraviolet-B receptor UVR8 isoform X1 [Prunus yedoensis var. nudiflora]
MIELPEGIGYVVQIAAGPSYVLAVADNGVVHSFGSGDEHAVALDSSGYVYTWGKGYCGALGHGDEIDKTTPELLNKLKSHLAVQVCARKRKTFVLGDNGSVYGCGWMGFLAALDFQTGEYQIKLEP